MLSCSLLFSLIGEKLYKMLPVLAIRTRPPARKIHQNSSTSFRVMLLTDKQTNKQKKIVKHRLKHNILGGGKQEAQLMLTTGAMRLAVSRGQQTWYHFGSVATFR